MLTPAGSQKFNWQISECKRKRILRATRYVRACLTCLIFRTEHSETKTTNATYGDYYAQQESKKIRIQPQLLKIVQYVDSNRKEFIKDLSEMIEFQSISGCLAHRDEVIKMIKFTEQWLIKLGIKYECFNIGTHELEGQTVRLPPVILGSIGKDPTKKTVCVYGYLDVKFPHRAKWKTDPYLVTEFEKKLYGNGVAGGKGPLISWFHVIAAFQSAQISLPVNVKFIIESMYHQNSYGLKDFLTTKKLDFFFDVDYVVFCDSQWLGDKIPCIIYGSVGLIHFKITVEKTDDSRTEPKEDLLRIFENIADKKGNILITKFHSDVAQITPDEEKLYQNIENFDPSSLRDRLPHHQQNWDKTKLLMHFWRLPAIYVDDIQECTCEKKDFSKVTREFILKIVPKQIVDRIIEQTLRYIRHLCDKLEIENKVDCDVLSTSRPWLEDSRSHNFEAARRATMQIYKEDPNMIRDDRDYKVLNILHAILEKNMLLLPLGNNSINAGKENENISTRNFFEGTKLLGAYLFQVAGTQDGR